MVQQDGVIRALLTAMATLQDLVAIGHDSHMALSTLEEISYELGRMDADERRHFIDGLERVAAQEPERAEWIRSVRRALGLDDPRALGLDDPRALGLDDPRAPGLAD
ncbi:hypothetical protein AB0M28_05965 [Streptomyces sp. NPDC051940]|uniref:hypothetical protein n=1 Tax=Streptomyces sp. NPDC051940 TaxID=3155675 RepID=UPI003449513B